MQDCRETPTRVDDWLASADKAAAGQGLVALPVITNGDLIYKVRALRHDLRDCNADKASLRQWATDMAKPVR